MLEIEKTFLVRIIPGKLSSFKSEKIYQGYLSSSPPALRIRQRGVKFELTKKIQLNKGDASTQEEINIPLTKSEFKKLWPLTEKTLEKTRYMVPLDDNLTAELDVFGGKLKGLAFVEVEFKSKEDMYKFKPPHWFGRDVTQEDFSANFYLAGKTFKEVGENIK